MRHNVGFLNQNIDLHKMGFNDFWRTTEKKGNSIRFLSFGDSFAVAITNPPYTYSAQLSQYLSEAKKIQGGVEVINLGRGGRGSMTTHEIFYIGQ